MFNSINSFLFPTVIKPSSTKATNSSIIVTKLDKQLKILQQNYRETIKIKLISKLLFNHNNNNYDTCNSNQEIVKKYSKITITGTICLIVIHMNYIIINNNSILSFSNYNSNSLNMKTIIITHIWPHIELGSNLFLLKLLSHNDNLDLVCYLFYF